MANERVLKARIQNKYETLENWNALARGNFIPLKGELCFAMDKDNSYGYYKVGDGETDFVDLPWLINQSDWNEYRKKTPGYIKNRPMYTEIPDDSEPILEIGYKNQDGLSESSIMFNSIVLSCDGVKIDRTNVNTGWKVYAKVQSNIDIEPIELNIEGPVYLNSFGEDNPIYYIGNLYRWYKFYFLIEEGYSDLSEVPPELIEELELMLEEMGLTDTGENYALVNLYGLIILILFDQVPGDLNNFNYNFDIYSYITIIHKLESKYLEEENLVGKFSNIDRFSEIFNDYSGNSASGYYTHAEGFSTIAGGGSSNDRGAHSEGYKTWASGMGAHAEGSETKATESGAHAEGSNTIASGVGAHTEGSNTVSGRYGHAEGRYTLASPSTMANGSSHAEGYGSHAGGDGSHAEGGNSFLQNHWDDFETGGPYILNYDSVDIMSDTRISLPFSTQGITKADIYSSELDFSVDKSGNLLNNVKFSEELVNQGKLTDVRIYIRLSTIGATGDYSHVEGCNNHAIGDYSHVEGYNNEVYGQSSHVEGEYNISKGSKNHVAGQYNKINGNGQFALGYGLQDDGNTSSNYPQIILGRYNKVIPNADLIVGAGIETDRHNHLVLNNQGELQIPDNRILDGEKNIWESISSKSSNTYNKTFHIFYEEDCDFERSNLIKPNLVKLHYSMSSGTPYIYYRNGNILPVDELENKTLDNGTTVTVDKENNCFIVDAKASDTKQVIKFYDLFSDADNYVQYYYCWDELADSEIYYGVAGTTNPGNNLIYHYNSILNDIISLSINIAPNVEKKITLPFPVLTTCVPPKKWVPPMEKILIPRDTKSVEVDISQYPFNGQVSMESPHKGTWSGTMSAVPKAIINENRFELGLQNYGIYGEITEDTYLADLKSGIYTINSPYDEIGLYLDDEAWFSLSSGMLILTYLEEYKSYEWIILGRDNQGEQGTQFGRTTWNEEDDYWQMEYYSFPEYQSNRLNILDSGSANYNTYVSSKALYDRIAALEARLSALENT